MLENVDDDAGVGDEDNKACDPRSDSIRVVLSFSFMLLMYNSSNVLAIVLELFMLFFKFKINNRLL